GARPKAHAGGQREQRVSAKQEFFEETDNHEHRCTEQCELNYSRSVQCAVPELKSVHAAQHTNEERHRSQAPNRAYPEKFPKCLSARKPVRTERTLLDLRHDHGRNRRSQEAHKLSDGEL